MSSTAAARIDAVAKPNTQEVVVTRTFNAPRDRVFSMYTDPALIPQWWGPARMTTIVETMEVRPGGRWRHVQHDPDGNEFAFHGVYHDVVAPERLVETFEFEGAPGHVSLDIVTFDDADGKTILTVHSIFESVEDRDQMLNAGMLDGMSEGMRRIDLLLEPVATR
jgi:uncharacterized protein YndB with AHSA1/START domain